MEAYLIFSDAKANHNKYYRMIDNGNGTFDAVWGRVGNEGQRKSYRMAEWSKKYAEKIAKGYKDISNLKADKSKAFVGEGADIINELISYSKKFLQNNYSNLEQVSQTQINEVYHLINYGLSVHAISEDITRFNDTLIEIFNTLPRVMRDVSANLAPSNATQDTLQKIINRETKLLNNMKSLAATQDIKTDKVEDLGLIIKPATDEERDAVIKHCNYSLQSKVKRVWSVVNTRTQDKFDKYVKDNNITNLKLLWHGSGNENWFSILENGLLIRPAGVKYTGSMFGDGLYFATDAGKSFNYTSYQGSYWRGGTSNKAFMAIYNTALGNPKDVYNHNTSYYSLNQQKLKKAGYNSLYAHKGSALLRDEIVFYTPEAVTVKYFVEFE